MEYPDKPEEVFPFHTGLTITEVDDPPRQAPTPMAVQLAIPVLTVENGRGPGGSSYLARTFPRTRSETGNRVTLSGVVSEQDCGE